MRVSLKNSELKFEKTISSNKLILGRSPTCDFHVSHESISRQHCLIENTNDQLFITDLGSANGILLNEERLMPNVRTPFQRYDQILIGPFELLITDEIDGFNYSQNTISKPINHTSDATQTKTLEKQLPPKSSSVRFIKKEKSPSFILSLCLAIGILGLGYYLNSSEDSNVIDSEINPVSVGESNSEVIKTISNQFKSSPEYSSLFEQKNCLGDLEVICKELEIVSSKEGIVKQGNEYFVFLSHTPSQSTPETIKKNEKDELSLKNFERLLVSDLMNQYFIHQNFQVHLILSNMASELIGVYRFHPNRYSAKTTKRITVLELLHSARETGESNKFWKYQEEFIPYMEFPK